MLTIRFLWVFFIYEDYLINKSSPNIKMLFWIILNKAWISVIDAKLSKSIWKETMIYITFEKFISSNECIILAIIFFFLRFPLLFLQTWLPFDFEWKRIASVYVLKLFALIKGVYSNVSIGSIKHIGTITKGILDIPIKCSIFPQNKFIPVIMLRG